MRVKLTRTWFSPDGVLYEPRDNPHTFPDSYGEKDKDGNFTILPSTAEVIGEDRIVQVERYTADNSVVIEEQVIDGDSDLDDLDGKADDPKAPSEVKLPTATVKTPTPVMTPSK